MGDSVERRDSDRLKVRGIFVKYRFKDSENSYRVELINVSSGGLCFLRDAIVHKSDEIEILFVFETKKIKLTAKVIRIEGREAAAQFIDSQDKIDDFVHYFNIEYPSLKRAAETYEQKKDDLFAHREKDDDKKNISDDDKKMFEI